MIYALLPSRVRLTRWVSCLLLLAACWCMAAGTRPALAQLAERPLIDGVTLGLGLTIYQGDLDQNPTNSPVEFVTAGNVAIMVGVDRQYGKKVAGLELHYNRLVAENFGIQLANSLVSLDAIGGYHLDLIRPDLIEVYGGLGVTWLMPSYERTSGSLDGFRAKGSRLILTLPLGVVVQDRVRLGIRLTNTDFIDGFEGRGGQDIISFVSVGYRFPVHP